MISVHQEGNMDLPDSLLPSLGDVSKPAQPVLLRSLQWRGARLTMQPWAAATTRVLLKRHIIQLRINNCRVAVGFIQLRTRRFALSPAFKQFLASVPFPLQGYFKNDFSLPLWRQARFLITRIFFAWPVGALHVLWVLQKHPTGQGTAKSYWQERQHSQTGPYLAAASLFKKYLDWAPGNRFSGEISHS